MMRDTIIGDWVPLVNHKIDPAMSTDLPGQEQIKQPNSCVNMESTIDLGKTYRKSVQLGSMQGISWACVDFLWNARLAFLVLDRYHLYNSNQFHAVFGYLSTFSAVIRKIHYIRLHMFHYKRASTSFKLFQSLRATILQFRLACAVFLKRPVANYLLFRFEHVLTSHATLPIARQVRLGGMCQIGMPYNAWYLYSVLTPQFVRTGSFCVFLLSGCRWSWLVTGSQLQGTCRSWSKEGPAGTCFPLPIPVFRSRRSRQRTRWYDLSTEMALRCSWGKTWKDTSTQTYPECLLRILL